MAKKEPIFLNFTNHPFEFWEDEQKVAARQYGEIMEIGFPQIQPMDDERKIRELAEAYAERISAIAEHRKVTVHIMGEMTFVYATVSLLKKRDITCIASTTKRKSNMIDNRNKLSEFQFVRFREY